MSLGELCYRAALKAKLFKIMVLGVLALNRNTKWATFTYVERETSYITKLFKNTNVIVAYTTNNNLGKLLTMKTKKQI
jgi:hypothetical protein